MAQEIADSKLLDTWGSGGAKIEPDISKIIEGWQLGEQPPHEYMNWLQNTFGSKLNHILKNGVVSWNNTTQYLAGSSVQHNGNVWLCKATNTNSEPTDLNANWEKVAINKDLTVTVDTLSDLRSISYPANTVWASGYHTKNDGAFGSHIFRLKGVKTTETDNGGTIIIATIGGTDYVYELQYNGAVNIKWFGAKGDESNDITSLSNSILSIYDNLHIPSGNFRVDGTITISSNKTIKLDGKLYKRSANTANDFPIIHLNGNYTSLIGSGVNSWIVSENNSPNGVVLWGSLNPETIAINFRFANVSNLTIKAKESGAGNKTLSLQNSQYWLGGALYDGLFDNLWLFNGYYQLYVNPISNGNIFNNLFFWNTRGHSIYLDGIAGGLVTDNSFNNIMVDGSFSNISTIYAKYSTHINFTNIQAEPGAGSLCNIDTSNQEINIIGVDNHPNASVFTPTTGTKILNGKVFSTQVDSKKLRIGGDTLIITENSDYSATYKSIEIDPLDTPYSGIAGMAIKPINIPGSGIADHYTYFKNKDIGDGSTHHHVVVDGSILSGASILPQNDSGGNIGSAVKRWATIYAGTGAINTSDDREKTYLDITETEKKVALELKVNMKKFKFNDAIAKKGEDNARIHFGSSAQTVKTIFEKHGLNGFDYSILCYDEWEDEYINKVIKEAEIDEYGKELTPEIVEEVLSIKAGNRYGIRYEELLCFIISSI